MKQKVHFFLTLLILLIFVPRLAFSEPAKPEPPKESTPPKSETPKTPAKEPSKPVEEKATNNGNLPVILHVTKLDGTKKELPLQPGRSLTLPEDAASVNIKLPMIISGYRLPDRKDEDVTITHPDGTTTTVDQIPFEGANVKIKHPLGSKMDYFQGPSFKLDPYRNALKADYKYNNSNNTDSDSQAPNSKDMDTAAPTFRSNVQYKF